MTMNNNSPTPLNLFIQTCAPNIIERIDVPPRPESCEPPPPSFATGAIGIWLSQMAGADTIWRHQARALEMIAMGSHFVMAIATASGKTLPIQAAVIREMIEGNGTAIVFYPLKALVGDQLARWRKALALAGLPETLVGEINGDVPMAERNRVIEDARIVLITRDAMHAWGMRHLATSGIRAFLGRLRFAAIDEVHTLEGVFGSNCAFFLRRLRSAVATIKAATALAVEPLQFIAATATVAEPVAHLRKLTGLDFDLVDESHNGAPTHGFSIVHVEGLAHGAPAEKTLAEMLSALASTSTPGAFIAFADKRQGVERITRRINRDDVLPYRSGYERHDRKDIEDALRAGEVRGIASTSALELGMDVPQFTFGFNLGVPMSLKAALQRIGRVGRRVRGCSRSSLRPTPSPSLVRACANFTRARSSRLTSISRTS